MFNRLLFKEFIEQAGSGKLADITTIKHETWVQSFYLFLKHIFTANVLYYLRKSYPAV